MTDAKPSDTGFTHDQLEEQLRERLEYVYGPLWERQDAAAFVREFFTPDAAMTFSDATSSWYGWDAIVGIIDAAMKDMSTLRPTVVWTRGTGKDAAAQFVSFQVGARDPGRQAEMGHSGKALYAWEKTPAGWRVVADHSAYVGMDPPG